MTYECWICGKEYDTYEEFNKCLNSHPKEDHK